MSGPGVEVGDGDRGREVRHAMLAVQLWPDVLSAVATAPDPRKGERLALVTQKKGATRGEFQAFAKQRGASDLMVPAEVVFIEKVPVLGTGKIGGAARLERRCAIYLLSSRSA